MTNSSGTAGSTAERRTPFSDEELEYFRAIILEKRATASEEIRRMRRHLAEARENADGDTAYSLHMAEAGTEAMEREKVYLMIARQQKFIGYLDRALDRIENKVYGLCKVTGKPISRERLEAVPHTQISIEAKRKQKS